MSRSEQASPLLSSAKWSLGHEKRRKSRSNISNCIKISLAALASILLIVWKINRENATSRTWTASSFNSTLGFGKIYTVSMPNFYMRRDELDFVALANNLQLTYVDAVDGHRISDFQLPFQRMQLTSGERGCWRSHLNVWKQMLHDGVDTALILEDDFDIDVRIREQLLDLRSNLIPLQVKSGTSLESMDMSMAFPGDWEILWVGACYEQEIDFKAGSPKPNFVYYEDPTVIDKELIHQRFEEFLDHYRAHVTDNGTNSDLWDSAKKFRLLQQSQSPYCTTGYALSKRGATRLYYALTRVIEHAVDVEMGWRSIDFKAYTAVPELVSPWKVFNGHNSILRPLDQDGISEYTDGKHNFNPSRGSSRNIAPEYSARQLLSERFAPVQSSQH